MTVKINHINYTVKMRKTADDMDADGHHNVANMMRTNGIAAQLYLQRGNGTRMYCTNEMTNGYINTPFTIGYW